MVFILQGLSPDTGTAVQQITVNHFHGTLAEGTDREPASWSSRSPMISPMCSTVRSSLLPERFTLSRAIMAINNSSRGHISRQADTARAADRPGGNSRWDESFPEPIPRSNPYLTGCSLSRITCLMVICSAQYTWERLDISIFSSLDMVWDSFARYALFSLTKNSFSCITPDYRSSIS